VAPRVTDGRNPWVTAAYAKRKATEALVPRSHGRPASPAGSTLPAAPTQPHGTPRRDRHGAGRCSTARGAHPGSSTCPPAKPTPQPSLGHQGYQLSPVATPWVGQHLCHLYIHLRCSEMPFFFPPFPLIPSSLSSSRKRSIPRQPSSSVQSMFLKQHADISSSSSFTKPNTVMMLSQGFTTAD